MNKNRGASSAARLKENIPPCTLLPNKQPLPNYLATTESVSLNDKSKSSDDDNDEEDSSDDEDYMDFICKSSRLSFAAQLLSTLNQVIDDLEGGKDARIMYKARRDLYFVAQATYLETANIGCPCLLLKEELTKAEEMLKKAKQEFDPFVTRVLSAICFSDEKYFSIPQGNKKAKTMMWLGITLKGITDTVWFDEAVDADAYFLAIRDGFYIASADGKRAPFTPILMQDNASVHGHLKEKFDNFKDIFKPFTLMAWPPRSPDLNPMEDVFAWLDEKKREAQVKFRNVADMYAWFDSFMKDNMSELMAVITNNILSFYGRLMDVIDSKGGLIRSLA